MGETQHKRSGELWERLPRTTQQAATLAAIAFRPLPRTQIPLGETKSRAEEAFYPTEKNEGRPMGEQPQLIHRDQKAPGRAREWRGRRRIQGES